MGSNLMFMKNHSDPDDDVSSRSEGTSGFLPHCMECLSGVTIAANSVNHPSSYPGASGLRRGIRVAIVGLGIGLLAFAGLTTCSSRTDGSNVPKSTIGKTGEMKSPGGSAYNSER
jgi:hypothetical protein